MKVAELKKILDSLADEDQVSIIYYTCGSEQRVSLDLGNLKLNEHGIDIDASYN